MGDDIVPKSHERAAPPDDQLERSLRDFGRVRFVGIPGLEVSLCSTEAEKEEALEFGLRVKLSNEQYALKSEQAFRDEYHDAPQRFEYIVARDERTGELAGDFRLQFHFDPLAFADNLLPEFRAYCEGGPHVVDIGGHIDRPANEKLEVFRGLWTHLTKLHCVTRFDSLYGQIRESYARRFVPLGHEVCTRPFPADAWEGEWLGVWVRFDGAPMKWRDEAFQRSWEKRTGHALNLDFWRAVSESLDAPEEWTGS